MSFTITHNDPLSAFLAGLTFAFAPSFSLWSLYSSCIIFSFPSHVQQREGEQVDKGALERQ